MSLTSLGQFDTERLSFTATQSSHGFSLLQAVYYDYGGSEWVLAIATSSTTVATHLVVRVLDTNTIVLASAGDYNLLVAHSLTEGEQQYLSDSVAGGLSSTAPNLTQRLLVATGTTTIRVNLSSVGLGSLPTGGTQGSLLYKTQATDYAIGWSTGIDWDQSSGNLGINTTGTPAEKLHVIGNIRVEGAVERGYQVKYTGDLNSNPNITNPLWTLGRLVEGGVANKSVFRFIFSSDDTVERSVFEVEDTGTIASVSDGTRRSHVEAFLNNGDTTPIFRLSSAVGAGPDMGLQFGPGGTTAPDFEFYRNGTNSGILALGGSVKNIWYSDGLTFQPGYNLNLGQTSGTAAELRFLEADASDYVGFKAPASIGTSQIYTLPATAPTTNGQVLSSTTAGVTSWIDSGVTGSSNLATVNTTTTNHTFSPAITLSDGDTVSFRGRLSKDFIQLTFGGLTGTYTSGYSTRRTLNGARTYTGTNPTSTSGSSHTTFVNNSAINTALNFRLTVTRVGNEITGILLGESDPTSTEGGHYYFRSSFVISGFGGSPTITTFGMSTSTTAKFIVFRG